MRLMRLPLGADRQAGLLIAIFCLSAMTCDSEAQVYSKSACCHSLNLRKALLLNWNGVASLSVCSLSDGMGRVSS